MTISELAKILAAIARRPGLWGPALSAARSMAKKKWWLKPPFLPVPDSNWVEFRLVTAYGTTEKPSDLAAKNQRVADVIIWIEWRRRLAQAARR